MNYLAHGYRFLDRPYYVAGTAIPDWMNVVDRRIRARRKHAEALLADDNPIVAELAAGLMQHHHDDDWFHRTRAFSELSLQFAVILRDELPDDEGLRPSFLGHILVELLLDDCLAQDSPNLLDDYYSALGSTDASQIATFVQLATGKNPGLMSHFIERFLEVRFLYDYADNGKLLFRLNQVMGRVGLATIPDAMLDLLPNLRSAVRARADDLMSPETNSSP